MQAEAASGIEGRWWSTEGRTQQLIDLARESSPLYVYDGPSVAQALSQLRSLSSIDSFFYAIKANPHPDVLRAVYEAGFGFECVSPGEVKHVLALFPGLKLIDSAAPATTTSPFRGGRLLFTPNFAPRKEYEYALSVGAIVTLDSLYPLQQWGSTFAGKHIMLRLDPSVRKGHHEHVKTAGKESKFGIASEELPIAAELAAKHGVHVAALHAHVGSGILSSTTWRENADYLAACARQYFPSATSLDLGGGLGIVEVPGEQTALNMQEVDKLVKEFKQKNPEFSLWLEPGRFPIAEAGVLLCTVTQLKSKGSYNYIGVDTGFNSLIRPILYAAHHQIVNLSRLHSTPGGPSITAEIVGNICESGDVFGHARTMPADTQEGDIVLIATAGAYGHSMASNYNLRDPATEHFLPN